MSVARRPLPKGHIILEWLEDERRWRPLQHPDVDSAWLYDFSSDALADADAFSVRTGRARDLFSVIAVGGC